MDFPVSRKAKIDASVVIGPYSIIEDDVVIGSRTHIGSHSIIKNGTVIGKNNIISAGAQIGVDPQDYHFKGERSYCIIGDNNVIREYATISRATGEGKKTVIGNNNFIMTYVHVAHNNVIGDGVVVSSIAQLGGYVVVGDYAKVCGLNTTGLLRNLFSWEEIEEIKDILRLLYRSGHGLAQCRDMLEKRNSCHAHEFLKFIETSKRGILLKESASADSEILSLS
jgi:UDP-N-acetylglucosamine acyltransferase